MLTRTEILIQAAMLFVGAVVIYLALGARASGWL